MLHTVLVRRGGLCFLGIARLLPLSSFVVGAGPLDRFHSSLLLDLVPVALGLLQAFAHDGYKLPRRGRQPSLWPAQQRNGPRRHSHQRLASPLRVELLLELLADERVKIAPLLGVLRGGAEEFPRVHDFVPQDFLASFL